MLVGGHCPRRGGVRLSQVDLVQTRFGDTTVVGHFISCNTTTWTKLFQALTKVTAFKYLKSTTDCFGQRQQKVRFERIPQPGKLKVGKFHVAKNNSSAAC